jgi:spore coat assembly protein SafA
VPLSQLLAANPQIVNPDVIYPGQHIAISGAGGSHVVRFGDTLSAIAQNNGVSLNALIQANPQISNPDLIYPGQTIVIPGGSGSPSTAPANGLAAVDAASGVRLTGDNPAAIAERFLNWNAGDLKVSGHLPMESWVPNNVNCANFVTAVLQEAGMINWHDNTVVGTRDKLLSEGWQRVDLSQARPGDVVVMDSGGQSHVVFFHSFDANGNAQFIGSNNRNADGSQRITWGGASGSYYLLTPPR